MPELEPAPFEAMPGIDIHVNGVAKLLRGVKAHKATGPDAIPARLLKEAADQLAPILTSIYRASLQQATVPEKWKKANVVPIFKKGDHSAASNYRPVSLTSIASKVMEHIISSQVMRHLDINAVLHGAQHGFRKRRSCETNLLEGSALYFRSRAISWVTPAPIMSSWGALVVWYPVLSSPSQYLFIGAC